MIDGPTYDKRFNCLIVETFPKVAIGKVTSLFNNETDMRWFELCFRAFGLRWIVIVQSFLLFRSREGFRKPTPHQSPSNSPISFVSPVPQPGSSPRSSRKKVVRLPMHSMTLRARKCPGRPTRAAKLPHTKL